MVNSHFDGDKKIHFLHVESKEIATLYNLCKKFAQEINVNYNNEEYLQSKFSDFRRRIHRFFTSIENYGQLLDEHLMEMLMSLVQLKQGFPDLFEKYCKPIVSQLKNLKENHSQENFIKQAIAMNLRKILEEDTYIVTRFSNSTDKITLDGIDLPIYKCTEFVQKAHFAKNLIFIGSPSQFDSKFTTLFFAENTYFITYDFFENRLIKKRLFQALPAEAIVSTLYDELKIDLGFKGTIFEVEIGQLSSTINKEEIAQQYINRINQIKEADQLECKLLILSNNCYIFVPLSTKLRRIDKDRLEMNFVKLNEIQRNDYLLFRNNSSVDLVMDVANKVLGDKALEYRAYQNQWKSKLERYINKYGIEKLSRILRKNGIEKANEINLRNWITPERIAPTQFEQLLRIMRFDEPTIKKNVTISKEIRTAHLKAGNKISKQLLLELNLDRLNEVEEKGYVTFTSSLVEGASFNIETVVEIHENPIIIDKKDAFKVWSDY